MIDFRKQLRLWRFARDNGLGYDPSASPARLRGTLFHVGKDKRCEHALASHDGRYEIAEYTVTIGKFRRTERIYRRIYMRYQLDRKLPHMFLDAKSDNLFEMTSLPFAFRKDQVLSLEGDFDKYFTLYVPKGYERDALYIFTPDLMALLVDRSPLFDVEIVDDQMFFYAKRKRYDKEDFMRRIFTIIDRVGQKTFDRHARYVDDRPANPAPSMISTAGKRMRRGIPWYSLKLRYGILVIIAVWGLIMYLISWVVNGSL